MSLPFPGRTVDSEWSESLALLSSCIGKLRKFNARSTKVRSLGLYKVENNYDNVCGFTLKIVPVEHSQD